MLPFYEVDVFAARPFMGNPLAVVLRADGLDAVHMQRIARWLNLSETVFVQDANEAIPTLRIFAPNRELPFAGHPLVGAGRVLVSQGLVDAPKGRFRVRCGRGTIRLQADDERVTATVAPPDRRSVTLDHGDVAHALGLQPDAIDEPAVFDAGATWLVTRVESPTMLADCRPALSAVEGLSEEAGLTGITAYAIDGDDEDVHTRSFAPAAGIPEDPVCGSGNLCVAAHAVDTGVADRLGGSWTAHQGRSVGRDGRIDLSVEGDQFAFGGAAIIRLEGKLTPGSV